MPEGKPPVAIPTRTAVFTLLLAAGLPFAADAQTCVPNTTPDWMTTVPSSVSSAQVRPADCATVQQTPPDFSWPDLSADASYQVTLIYPDGRTKTLTAPQNWINWDEVLLAGAYTWQVQVTNANGAQLSRPRRFMVDASAVPFLVPDWTVLFNRAATKPHPRALADPATAQAMINQRQTGLGLLFSRVDSLLAAPVQAEPAFGLLKNTISAQAQTECRLTSDAALAWLVTGKEEYWADALRRALNLASWDPRGATSYANVDEDSRLIAGTLTLAYDWLFQRLDAGQKNLLLASILARGADMYNDVIGSRSRIAIHPYDSHGNITLTYLAVMTVLLAGDIPEAQYGLRDTLPLALNWTSPWGGEDGGFGNGSAYATWTSGDLLVPWYSLRWTVGVDIAQKAWVRNYANFLAYSIPPGTPTGIFGDGAEQALTENWARFGKAHALFAPSPLGRWYAAQLGGEDPSALQLLLAPPADPGPAPFPAGILNSALFSSIGWVAMHSSLQDSARTSVYFKASPYGSYNHSHADQNSFVIHAGGRPLAIDSGYYDEYNSPHWWQWYKQTRAHNAITFDGGQGQAVFESGGQLGPGAITGYARQPDYDIVTGDATPAYGGALTEAKRSLVYLRPNLILVYDRLASDIPRQWEWNIHAVNAMDVFSSQKISIQNNGRSLCVDMLAGPAMQFTQTDLFTVDPVTAMPRQWHGKFSSTGPLGAAEFIGLLNVDCTPVTASASKTNGVWTVTLGARRVIIDAVGNASVQ